MKNKYNDNRLAEIADGIILTRNCHVDHPSGTVGILSKDYRGRGRGFEGLFGEDTEPIKLKMNEFRVLCPEKKCDQPRLYAARLILLRSALG
jgi:hypothetical protein